MRVHRLPACLPSPARVALALCLALVGLAGCRSAGPSAPPSEPWRAAGVYSLVTVGGDTVPTDGLGAVLAGTLTLRFDGTAERRVTYARSGLPGPAEIVAVGTFRATESSLELALREGPNASWTWRPRATLSPDPLDGPADIQLTYPHPADGPDIVEVYRRSAPAPDAPTY